MLKKVMKFLNLQSIKTDQKGCALIKFLLSLEQWYFLLTEKALSSDSTSSASGGTGFLLAIKGWMNGEDVFGCFQRELFKKPVIAILMILFLQTYPLYPFQSWIWWLALF